MVILPHFVIVYAPSHWKMKLLDKEGLLHRPCPHRVQLASTTSLFRAKGNIPRKNSAGAPKDMVSFLI